LSPVCLGDVAGRDIRARLIYEAATFSMTFNFKVSKSLTCYKQLEKRFCTIVKLSADRHLVHLSNQ